ncbi:MAG TPA: hypothetical protein VFT50_02710 [Baekduia sp.]|nr:hypothetical protein [Baekduia sp.]
MPLLAGLASLLIAGGAVAGVTGLLDNGDPVPSAPSEQSPVVPTTQRLVLASVRAADPDGGPPWGIGTYDATARGVITAGKESVTCVVVGRVQNGRLGVVGRDDVFDDDGRFHPLSPTAEGSGMCTGRAADGAFVAMSSGPPIPASGFTGAPGGAVGGCRERVNLDGPTVSPQTRRKLRHVPQCSRRGLRDVVAGFAGPLARTATLTAPGYRKSLELRSADNGAYLFVLRPTTGTRPRLDIIDRQGRTCRDVLRPMPDPGPCKLR